MRGAERERQPGEEASPALSALAALSSAHSQCAVLDKGIINRFKHSLFLKKTRSVYVGLVGIRNSKMVNMSSV